jgi:GT2 family glycosyltransferase
MTGLYDMGKARLDAAKSRGDSIACEPVIVETPVLVIEPASGAPNPGSGIGVATINYRTKTQTLRCIESLRQSETPPEWLYILDNSELDDGLEDALRALPPFEYTRIAYYRSTKNLGFAEGSNVLIDRLFESAGCQFVLFLNNDAVALPLLLGKLKQALIDHPGAGLSGPRVHKLDDPTQIDSLGIVIYKSLMPADRYSTDEPYLGPSGGCAMATRSCLEELKITAGYFFDPKLFCYCEDTDLVLRANLIGYQPHFVDEVLALHEGQASTNRGYNRFIAYHGLRNSTWVAIKLFPLNVLVRNAGWHALATLLSIAHHAARGRFRLLLDVYRDMVRGLGVIKTDRLHIRSAGARAKSPQTPKISDRFYRRGYLIDGLRRTVTLR